jgi:hypothetical protein
MAQFNVLVNVEADTLEGAEALVAEWTLTAGAVVVAIHTYVQSESPPVTIGEDGWGGGAPPPATAD